MPEPTILNARPEKPMIASAETTLQHVVQAAGQALTVVVVDEKDNPMRVALTSQLAQLPEQHRQLSYILDDLSEPMVVPVNYPLKEALQWRKSSKPFSWFVLDDPAKRKKERIAGVVPRDIPLGVVASSAFSTGAFPPSALCVRAWPHLDPPLQPSGSDRPLQPSDSDRTRRSAHTAETMLRVSGGPPSTRS